PSTLIRPSATFSRGEKDDWRRRFQPQDSGAFGSAGLVVLVLGGMAASFSSSLTTLSASHSKPPRVVETRLPSGAMMKVAGMPSVRNAPGNSRACRIVIGQPLSATYLRGASIESSIETQTNSMFLP